MSENKSRSAIETDPGKDHLALERLVFFSDAVFAIAITLLALEIRLPSAGEGLTNAELASSLFNLWPAYLGYAISFMVIGFFLDRPPSKIPFYPAV